MVALGIGFGVAQSASMTTMLARVEPAAYGTVNAVWNTAFDLGWGVGSIAVGVLVGAVGYGPAFVVTAIAVALVADEAAHSSVNSTLRCATSAVVSRTRTSMPSGISEAETTGASTAGLGDGDDAAGAGPSR